MCRHVLIALVAFILNSFNKLTNEVQLSPFYSCGNGGTER